MGDRAIDSPLPFLLQLKSRCVFFVFNSGPARVWTRSDKKEKKRKAKAGGQFSWSQTVCHFEFITLFSLTSWANESDNFDFF